MRMFDYRLPDTGYSINLTAGVSITRKEYERRELMSGGAEHASLKPAA
jgi:hypothetical protein